MKNILCTVISILSLVISPIAASAQVATGGTFVLEQTVIAGGGGSNSIGGTFSLDGTIGQAVAGNALTGGDFAVTSGFWNFTPAPIVAQGFEGDVITRPNGNTLIEANDVNQVERFLIGLDLPFQSNEFQRADAAPFLGRGNGLIEAGDVNQTERYLIGLDGGTQAAGGPPGPIPNPLIEETPSTAPSIAPTTGGRIFVENASAGAGQQVIVRIRVDIPDIPFMGNPTGFGNESGFGYTLNYNQSIMTPLVSGATAVGTTLGTRTCNTTTTPGRVTCSSRTFPGEHPGSSTDQIGEITSGNNQFLLSVTFNVAAGAAPGVTPLTLTAVSATDDASNGIPITVTNGTMTVTGPTAASASVSGRVLTAQGGGLTGVRVTLAGGTLTAPRQALTSSFGYFTFEDIEAGHTYIITVSAKRYGFAQPTQVISVLDNVTDIVFVADPQE